MVFQFIISKKSKLQFTYSPLILSYLFTWRLISCQGKDSLILCACTESFTNAFLISVTDLISWMSNSPDISMVFVILKSLSMQKEWKRNQFNQISWIKFAMWNSNVIHIFIIISHDQLDFLPETDHFAVYFWHSFWILTPSLDQREKAFFILSASQILSLFLQPFLKIIPLLLSFFLLFSPLSITGSHLGSNSRQQTNSYYLTPPQFWPGFKVYLRL